MGLESERDDRLRSEAEEVDRMRAVYRRRDAGRPASALIQEASRRLWMERIALMRETLASLLEDPYPRLLDVGCGSGGDLSHLRSAGWPADGLAGVDLLPNRLAAARVACPDVELRLAEGSSIPFPDGSFDVVNAATVFSSILDRDVRRDLFAEMERVVRPGGIVMIYDFVIRKPTNPDVVGMPLRRLAELGRRPDGTIRLSPVLHVVAAAAVLHPRLADLAMRLAPRTHRLTYWRKPSPNEPASTLDT